MGVSSKPSSGLRTHIPSKLWSYHLKMWPALLLKQERERWRSTLAINCLSPEVTHVTSAHRALTRINLGNRGEYVNIVSATRIYQQIGYKYATFPPFQHFWNQKTQIDLVSAPERPKDWKHSHGRKEHFLWAFIFLIATVKLSATKVHQLLKYNHLGMQTAAPAWFCRLQNTTGRIFLAHPQVFLWTSDVG